MNQKTSPFQNFLDPTHPSVIFKNRCCVAYLESQPILQGHVVIFLKEDLTDSWWELSEVSRNDLLSCASKVAGVLKMVYPCEKVALASLGLLTRQAHIHLLPIQSAGDFRFDGHRMEVSQEAHLEQVEILRRFLNEIDLK